MAGSFKRDSVLGLVFFGGLLLLLVATAFLAEFSFGEKERIEVRFADARGLKKGGDVLVLGVRSGLVSEVRYEPGNVNYPIRMMLELDRKISFKTDYKITIADAALLGGKQITIRPGRSGKPVDLSETRLFGISPPNPIEALGEMIGAEGNKANLAQILEDIATLTSKMRRGEGSLGKLMTDDEVYNLFRDLVESLGETVAEARAGKGSVGEVLASARRAFDSADKTITAVRDGDGLAGRLINDKGLADTVEATLGNIKSFSDDLAKREGVLAKLISDPETARQLDSIIGGFDQFMTKVNTGDGLLAALASDAQIRDDVKATVASVRSVTDSLNSNSGTLGRLINDPTVANQLETLLRQASRTLEDVREAAPVATFVAVFSGSFQ